jgi:hypothetical protein
VSLRILLVGGSACGDKPMMVDRANDVEAALTAASSLRTGNGIQLSNTDPLTDHVLSSLKHILTERHIRPRASLNAWPSASSSACYKK